jgi:hypothetical protein
MQDPSDTMKAKEEDLRQKLKKKTIESKEHNLREKLLAKKATATTTPNNQNNNDRIQMREN